MIRPPARRWSRDSVLTEAQARWAAGPSIVVSSLSALTVSAGRASDDRGTGQSLPGPLRTRANSSFSDSEYQSLLLVSKRIFSCHINS